MDRARFDTIAKSLRSRGPRRQALGALVGLAATGALGRHGGRAKPKDKAKPCKAHPVTGLNRCCQYQQQEGDCPDNGGDVAPFSCTEICPDTVNEGGEEIPCKANACSDGNSCGKGFSCVASACCGHAICVRTCGPKKP